MAVAGLTFVSRYGNVAVSDVAGGVVLQGEAEWIVEGGEAEIATILAVMAGLAGKTSARSAILKFGNHVGTFDLGALGHVHVQCGKLTEGDFDAMLADLTQKVAALPFSAAQTAGIPHDRSIAERDDVLLHAFIYARHVLLAARGDDSLARALEFVVRDPHRRFGSERASVDLAAASRIDTRTITRIAAGGGRLVRAPEQLAHGGLAHALGGFVPERVDVPKVIHSYDTAENRFVREFLSQVRAIIERVERIAVGKGKPSPFWSKTVADCSAMRRVLAPFERHDMWNGVRAMDHVPIGSTVLQRRRGYKEVLRHYLAMRAAANIPLDGAAVEKHLLGLKDVATLYELWCYFAVVDALAAVLQRGPDFVDTHDVKIDKVVVGRGFVVGWGGGPKLHYNPTFTSKRDAPWRSVSLMLRPDVVIELERDGQVELHAFDAKLKVDGLVLVHPDVEDAAEEDEADPLTFEKDDIAKMHAYRDALPAVRSARVLYPGNVARDFPPGAPANDVVGALPLVPGHGSSALEYVLGRLLVTPTETGTG